MLERVAPRGGAGSRRLLPVALGMLFVTACGAAHTAAVTTAPPVRAAAQSHATPASPPDSLVATAVGHRIPVYRSATSTSSFLRLANPISSGAPLTFLVRTVHTGRDEVYLAARPNGQRGWIAARSLTVARDPYSLRVSLRSHRLVLLRRGRVVARFSVAVGKPSTPTPVGLYYIVELLAQPDPGGDYGPYAFGISAFSDVLQSFGGGPGQIGIHGTNDAGSIGHSVSHGCIRLDDAAIVRLSRLLPLGTAPRCGSRAERPYGCGC